MSSGGIVVIGVGNPLRGDDGVGLAIAARLAAGLPEGVRVERCEQEPSRLIDAWSGADAAVLVDAVSSGSPPGTIHRFDATDAPVPAGVFRSSTHAFGLSDAIELSRALGSLPRRVVVYGVEGADFSAGAKLTAAALTAVDRVAAAIRADLAPPGEEEPCTSGP